jgi:hypothetical protein
VELLVQSESTRAQGQEPCLIRFTLCCIFQCDGTEIVNPILDDPEK